jgi:hypothetical protein
MALILLFALFASQFLILWWKKKHYRSYQALSFTGLLFIPLFFGFKLGWWRFITVWVLYGIVNSWSKYLYLWQFQEYFNNSMTFKSNTQGHSKAPRSHDSTTCIQMVYSGIQCLICCWHDGLLCSHVDFLWNRHTIPFGRYCNAIRNSLFELWLILWVSYKQVLKDNLVLYNQHIFTTPQCFGKRSGGNLC